MFKAAKPTENDRVTLEFREEWFSQSKGRWIYKNPSKPHFGADRSPYPGSKGAPIFAPFDGVIQNKTYSNAAVGYGNELTLEFTLPFQAVTRDVLNSRVLLPVNKPLTARFAHCDSMSVQAGESVKAGQQIATIGDTGFAVGAHLHWEIISNTIHVDPEMVLKQALEYAAKEAEKLEPVRFVRLYQDSKEVVSIPVPEGKKIIMQAGANGTLFVDVRKD